MSQIENGYRPDAIRPRSVRPIPRQGLTADLNAPGLTTTSVVFDNGVRMADELASALGLSAGAVGAVAQVSETDRRRAALLAAESERQDREAASALRGRGEELARSAAPDIEAAVEHGLIPVPVDGADVLPAADRALSARLAEMGIEVNSPFGQGFFDAARPQLARALAGKRARDGEVRKTELNSAYASRAESAQTVDELDDLVEEAVRLGVVPGPITAKGSYVVPAMNKAARSGDRARFDVLAASLGDDFAETRAIAAQSLSAAEDAARADRQDAAVRRIYKMLDNNEPVESVFGFLEATRGRVIDEKTAYSLRGLAINKAQRTYEMGLRTQILNNAITADRVAEIVREAATLPEDSPRYMDPATGQTILNSVSVRDRSSVAESQVRAVMAGQMGNLSETQHGAAFSKLLGPEGLSLFDETNRITNPGQLVLNIAHARIAPAPIRAAVVASLTSPDPQDVTNAAHVLGALSVSNPSVYYDFVNDYAQQPAVRNMVEAAAESFVSGRLNDPKDAIAEAERIRVVGATSVQGEKPAPESLASIKAVGLKLDAELSSAVGASRSRYPHLVDRTFGIDWLDPDPALPELGDNVREKAELWYAQRWAQKASLPTSARAAEARRYVTDQLSKNVDFVRWGDLIQPVMIDDGHGMKLPESLRWNSAFEKEAKADVQALGFDPDRIATLRPYLAPATEPGADPTAAMGWTFITVNGDDLRDDRGRLVVFKPSDQAKAENDRLRAMLDDRVWEFEAARMSKHRLIGTAVESHMMNYKDLPPLPEIPGADRNAAASQ